MVISSWFLPTWFRAHTDVWGTREPHMTFAWFLVVPNHGNNQAGTWFPVVPRIGVTRGPNPVVPRATLGTTANGLQNDAEHAWNAHGAMRERRLWALLLPSARLVLVHFAPSCTLRRTGHHVPCAPHVSRMISRVRLAVGLSLGP